MNRCGGIKIDPLESEKELHPVIQKFIQKQIDLDNACGESLSREQKLENALKAIVAVDHKPTYVQAYFACIEIAKRALA